MRPRLSSPAPSEPTSNPALRSISNTPNVAAVAWNRSIDRATMSIGTGATTMLSVAPRPSSRPRPGTARNWSSDVRTPPRDVAAVDGTSVRRVGRGSDVAATNAADQANVAAFTTITQPMPATPISTPPRSGPSSPPTALLARLRPFAAGRSASSTMVGTAVAYAGSNTAVATPASATSAQTTSSGAFPLNRSDASSTLVTRRAASAPSIRVRRSSRSAHEPPRGEHSTTGTIVARATATSSPLPPWCLAHHSRAMRCIPSPTTEID